MTTKAPRKTKPAKPAASPAATAPTTKGLDRHPLSEKFSLPTTEAERLALAEDMLVHGQHQEIVLFEGQVLDGWERYLGCVQRGITPKFKTYTGDSPAAVAFGLNAIRRKLNSVQKALFGAKYLLHMQSEGHSVTQQQVAKSACCSLQRLNEIAQLIRAADSNTKAAKCLATLNTNPDVTAAMLQEMLVDANVINPNTRKPAAGLPNDFEGGEGDEDDDDILGDASGDAAVDLLGGADVDDLLDGDDDDEAADKPKRDKKDKRVGSDRNPRETPASLVSKHYRALTEPERVDFVQFAWAMLRPAIEQCLLQKRVEWPKAGVHADAGTAALANAAGVLASAATGKAKASSKGKPAKPASGAAAARQRADEARQVAAAKLAAKPASKAPAKPARVPTVAASKATTRAKARA
jgi:hypothetical protein